MRTSGQSPISRTGTQYNIASRKVVSTRNGTSKAHYGSLGSRNAFLKSKLRSISPQFLSANPDDKNTNCITRQNYTYLRDSYYRYAGLLGVAPKHDAGQSYGDGIADLFHRMETIVGDEANVNIEADGNSLHFTLWRPHYWKEYNLYWFPVKFVKSLSPRMQRIATTFLHRLSVSSGIPTMNGTDLAEYALDWIETYIDDPVCEECEEMKAICDSYREGEAIATLKEVENGDGIYADLEAAIDGYAPRNDKERLLIELIREGSEFIRTGSPRIMRYAYDPHYETNPEFEPIRLDQQIMIIYDSRDTVTEYMIDILNGAAVESYEILPCTTLDISPSTKRPFIMDDYPERFFRWAGKFLSFISSYDI